MTHQIPFIIIVRYTSPRPEGYEREWTTTDKDEAFRRYTAAAGKSNVQSATILFNGTALADWSRDAAATKTERARRGEGA